MLVTPRAEAEARLADRIEKGQELQHRAIESEKELEQARDDYHSWYEYNKRLLGTLFNNSSEADKYRPATTVLLVSPTTLYEQIETFRSGVRSDVRKLCSIVEQLELIPVAPDVQTLDGPAQSGAEIETPNVFISHSSADKDSVEELAKKLAENGIEPWYAGWEIGPGDSIVQKINEGLENCDVFVIVVSENSVHSQWVKEELSSAVIRRIEHQARIIPVRLDDAPVPSVINHLHWVKMHPLEEQLPQLVKAIFKVSDKPPIGEVPEYVRRARERASSTIEGLSPEASAVLKYAVLQVGLDGEVPVFELSEILGLTATEVDDAVDELEEQELIKPMRTTFGDVTPTAGAWLHISSDELGFDLWRDMLAVAQCVVNHGRISTDILEADTGLSQQRINIATLALEHLGAIKLIRYSGTTPYHFGEAQATRQTREWLRENREEA